MIHELLVTVSMLLLNVDVSFCFQKPNSGFQIILETAMVYKCDRMRQKYSRMDGMILFNGFLSK